MPPCDVCLSPLATITVPDRDLDELERCDELCLLCLDAMLSAFPLTPRRMLGREQTGKTNWSAVFPRGRRPPIPRSPGLRASSRIGTSETAATTT